MIASDSTTHSVYRIVCFPTGRVYVGQTRNPSRRKNEHFKLLQSGKHYNPHMQQSYNKYGGSCFYFEVIETDIPSNKINEREKYWVGYYPERFNITDGGEQGEHVSNPCVWNGISYKSVKEAAEFNGINQSTMSSRLARGLTSDKEMTKKPQKCTWNGVQYSSIDSAADVVGVTKRTMAMYLRRGYTCDKDVPGTGGSKQITWGGVTYKSIIDAAAHLGVNHHTLSWQLKHGYRSNDDIPGNADHLKKTCSWNGYVYASLTDAAKANGYAKSSFSRYIKQGFSCDNDVLTSIPKHSIRP